MWRQKRRMADCRLDTRSALSYAVRRSIGLLKRSRGVAPAVPFDASSCPRLLHGAGLRGTDLEYPLLPLVILSTVYLRIR